VGLAAPAWARAAAGVQVVIEVQYPVNLRVVVHLLKLHFYVLLE
jgi:hypothetical protein